MGLMDLLGKKLLFFDGALGTMLQQKGLPTGALPELQNLLRPDDIYELHCRNLKAGADILDANTFGANRLKLEPKGYRVDEVVGAALDIAKRAIRDEMCIRDSHHSFHTIG